MKVGKAKLELHAWISGLRPVFNHHDRLHRVGASEDLKVGRRKHRRGILPFISGRVIGFQVC